MRKHHPTFRSLNLRGNKWMTSVLLLGSRTGAASWGCCAKRMPFPHLLPSSNFEMKIAGECQFEILVLWGTRATINNGSRSGRFPFPLEYFKSLKNQIFGGDIPIFSTILPRHRPVTPPPLQSIQDFCWEWGHYSVFCAISLRLDP